MTTERHVSVAPSTLGEFDQAAITDGPFLTTLPNREQDGGAVTEAAGRSVARLYAILRRLNSARHGADPTWWTVSTDELRQLSPDYSLDGVDAPQRASARKLLQRDLKKLADRGLIETGVTTEQIQNARGVRYRVQEKPGVLHLTRDEHAALQRARRLLQPNLALVTYGPSVSDLDIADSAMQALMERRGWATGPALANALGVPDVRLRAILLALHDELDLVPIQVREDEETWEVELTDGALSAGGERGLGAIGRFAYTRAEVDERLSVIERAKADERTSKSDQDLLSSAAGKLQRWATEYLKPATGDGRRRGDPSRRRGRLSAPGDVSTR